MSRLRYLTAILLFHILLGTAVAQDKTIDKIEKVTQGLERIFKKKPKTGSDTKSTNGDVAAQQDQPGTETGKKQDKAGQRPGDIAAGAKAIDADVFYDFNMGAAVVGKAMSFGLIDMNGNFIVPYNKYNRILSYTQEPITHNGLFLINNDEGAIDTKGKLLTEGYPANSKWGYGSDDNLLILCTSNYSNAIYLDGYGHKYVLKQRLSNIVDGIGICESGGMKGYKNLKDEWVVRPAYDFAAPFSDGMACVGKRDEFRQIKYGFIDKTGKEVIPLKYSKLPDDFKAGLTRVTPTDINEFHEAYIDKKGNIVQKLNNFYMLVYIGNGIYVRNYQYMDLLDSTGKMTMRNDYLEKLGVVLHPATDKAISLIWQKCTGYNGYNIGKLVFNRSFKQGVPNVGYVDIKTKQVMEGAFTFGTSLHFYDPVSKLSVATFNTTGKIDKTPLRQGYINEQGLFVIIKAESSKW